MKKIATITFMTLVLFSCSISHNIPSNQTPNEAIPPNISKVFVDQNGTFYPDNWEITYGSHDKNARKYAYSINTWAKRKGLSEELSDFEKVHINKLKLRLQKKDRIFVLVHGYNNSEYSAKKSFARLQDIISFDESTDEFVEFYWDGLTSSSLSGSLKIWFNAAGYSQMAGEFGLRRVLNSIKEKEIILISHSRGASVVLSALSNPPYAENFAKKTFENDSITVGNPTSLEENGNSITSIMLAPAIGLIDFKKPEYYIGNDEYRTFSSQLKSIHVTINKDDPKLKKFIGPLSRKFNPTNIGYEPSGFIELNKTYSLMDSTNYTGMKSHAFLDYLNNPKFIEILNKYGIGTR